MILTNKLVIQVSVYLKMPYNLSKGTYESKPVIYVLVFDELRSKQECKDSDTYICAHIFMPKLHLSDITNGECNTLAPYMKILVSV